VSCVDGPLVLALLRARSPILGWLALSVFNDAARFLANRVNGRFGVGDSEFLSG
jgi:hypothetical protein